MSKQKLLGIAVACAVIVILVVVIVVPGLTPHAYDLTIESTEGGAVSTPGEGTFTYDAGRAELSQAGCPREARPGLPRRRDK